MSFPQLKKNDGFAQFCFDHQKYCISKGTYLIPSIYDTMDTLAGFNWFSSMDNGK